jgi:hypothetical protein
MTIVMKKCMESKTRILGVLNLYNFPYLKNMIDLG